MNDYRYTKSREGKMPMSYQIPVELHNEFKTRCHEQGLSMGYMIEKLVSDYVVSLRPVFKRKKKKDE